MWIHFSDLSSVFISTEICLRSLFIFWEICQIYINSLCATISTFKVPFIYWLMQTSRTLPLLITIIIISFLSFLRLWNTENLSIVFGTSFVVMLRVFHIYCRKPDLPTGTICVVFFFSFVFFLYWPALPLNDRHTLNSEFNSIETFSCWLYHFVYHKKCKKI